MLWPDRMLLVVVLLLAGWWLFAPASRPRARLVAVGLAAALALAQAAACGFTWQDLPAYPLLALSALPPAARFRRTRRAVVTALAIAAGGAWLVPAVPTLPRPDGRYPVGTAVFRWTDGSRDEPSTPDAGDRRSVIAQAWYPATVGGADRRRTTPPYLDGLDRLPPTVGGLPRFLLHRFGQIDTHARPGAPLAPRPRPWPVVILSPGYGAPRAIYTGLATRLAGRGFVVLALDHPYESAVTELPDGRVVAPREVLRPGERTKLPYMIREQARRTADVRFVIDRLARPGALAPSLAAGQIDAARVAVIGHSFGGAAAIAAMSEDARVVAAANIDGTPYGDLPTRRLSRPLLVLESDRAETRHSRFFDDGNARLLAHDAAPAYRYEIKGADHLGFTDAPDFLAAPARWLLSRIVGGERGPAATQRATADMLAAFLAGPLTGAPSDIAAAAARYPGVVGGAVSRRPHPLDRADRPPPAA